MDAKGGRVDNSAAERKSTLNLPEENLLYFLEKNSPALEPWQREILRIVRIVAQYFYPQRQTQVMNEGCATFVHHTLMNTLFDRGMIDETVHWRNTDAQQDEEMIGGCHRAQRCARTGAAPAISPLARLFLQAGANSACGGVPRSW